MKELEIVSRSTPLPFQLDEEGVDETLRIRYRWLDLRREKMQRNLRLRSVVNAALRTSMVGQGFVEITVNFTTLRLDTAKSGRPMNLMHGAFAVGAILGPLALGVSLSLTSYALSASRGLVGRLPGGVSLLLALLAAELLDAEAAARHYFRKPAAQLSAYEAARLAVMLPRPKYFEKLPNSGYLQSRAQTIVARMPNAELP